AHVERDLHQARDLHRRAVAEVLGQRGPHGVGVDLLQPRRTGALVLGRRAGRLGLLLATGLLGLDRLVRPGLVALGRLVCGGLGLAAFVFCLCHRRYLLVRWVQGQTACAGNLVPVFTPTRSLPPPSAVSLVRVPRPSLSSQSSTFAIAMVPSFS